jgi:hypothetical protein
VDPASRQNENSHFRKKATCYRHIRDLCKYVIVWDESKDNHRYEYLSEDELENLQSANWLDLNLEAINITSKSMAPNLSITNSLPMHNEDPVQLCEVSSANTSCESDLSKWTTTIMEYNDLELKCFLDDYIYHQTVIGKDPANRLSQSSKTASMSAKVYKHKDIKGQLLIVWKTVAGKYIYSLSLYCMLTYSVMFSEIIT